MGKVHLFEIDNTLFPDTRVPFQFRGNARDPEARAFELSALLTFIEENISIVPAMVTITTAAPSTPIVAGALVEKIVVVGSTSGTFKLGTTSGGTEILDGEAYSSVGSVFVFNQYFQSAGALHFSGFTGTLTVKIYTR